MSLYRNSGHGRGANRLRPEQLYPLHTHDLRPGTSSGTPTKDCTFCQPLGKRMPGLICDDCVVFIKRWARHH